MTNSKRIARLKEQITFRYDDGVNAVIAPGEVGTVISEDTNGFWILFTAEVMVTDRGIPNEPRQLKIPGRACEITTTSEDGSKQGSAPAASLPSGTKTVSEDYAGAYLFCLACNHRYEAPPAPGIWACPNDATTMLYITPEKSVHPNMDDTQELLCLRCVRVFPFHILHLDEPLLCPFDRTQLVVTEKRRLAITQRSVTTASGHEYELEEKACEVLSTSYFFRGKPRSGDSSQSVLCKLIFEKYRKQKVLHESMEQEFNNTKALDDDGILKILDRGVVRGSPFLVFENFEGETLATVVTKYGALRAYDALLIAARICRTLLYLESKSTFHPDLKPTDVFVSFDRRLVKLTNFQATSANGYRTQELNELAGVAAAFACIDVMKGRISIASNVYSLGSLLFYMLTGQRPFKGRSPLELARNQFSAGVPRVTKFKSELPRELDSLVSQLMDPLPERRPTPEKVDQMLSIISRQV